MKKYQLLVLSSILLSAGNPLPAEEGGIRVQIQPGANPGPGAGANPRAQGGGFTFNGGTFVGKSAAAWYIEGIEKTVKLTPEQKEAMTKVIDARDKAGKELQEKNGGKMNAALQAMTEAYKTKDKDAIAKAQKDYQEASAETTNLYKKAQADLDNVLTAEQKAHRQEQIFAQTIKWMTEPAVLTAEQTERIKSILATQNATGRREGGERAERDGNDAIQNVLTAEQKALIAKHRAVSQARAMYGRANLSAEQSQKIESAYDELAKTPNLNNEAITKKLSEKIEGLLTAEQKETMKKGKWSGLQAGAALGQRPGGALAPGSAAPGQPANRPGGSPQIIRIGEGGDTLSLTVNGEAVKTVPRAPGGGREPIRFLGEHREMESGAWLGLAIEPASEALRAQLSLGKEEGILVTHVLQSSPANRAGLARNDILLRLDDQILVEPSQFRKLIAMKKAGDKVKLVYLRKAERKETSATLIEHAIESAGEASPAWPHMAPGGHPAAEGETREVQERLQHLLRSMKEKPPGAPLQPGAPVPPGASPLPLNPAPPRER